MPNRKRGMTDVELKGWLETQYDVNENGCWVWRGGKTDEYGSIGYKGRSPRVHRLYWLLSGRTIPEGLGLLHGKDCSKACYNPEHLHPGNQSENALDCHRDNTMTHAKLTSEQILEIRARTDKTIVQLAEEYNVSFQHISAIITRKRWSWI
jgi:hypothetical protein